MSSEQPAPSSDEPMAVNETIQPQREGETGEIVPEPLSADARRASEKAADALANAAIKRFFERHACRTPVSATLAEISRSSTAAGAAVAVQG